MTDKLWSSKKYHIKKQNHGKFSIEDGMIFAITNKLPNKGLFYCQQKWLFLVPLLKRYSVQA